MADRDGLRVLIADDELPARIKLRRFLEQEPGIATIYEAWDGETTLMVLREAEPDIAFLDIQMPGRSGLEVLASLPAERLPQAVFVTAYDEHAVRAFEIGAVDYLLKPFDRERFGRAFRRAREAASDKDAAQNLQRLVAFLRDSGVDSVTPAERLLVDDGDKRLLLPASRVDRLDAERNYVRIHADGAIHRVRGTLSEFESRLDPRRFARVGRSTIVNLDRVSHLEPAGHGDYLMILADGTRVRLSRRYASRVEPRLGA